MKPKPPISHGVKSIAYRLLAALERAPDGMLPEGALLPLLALGNRNTDKLAVQAGLLCASGAALQLSDGLRLLPAGREYLQQNHCAAVFAALPELKRVYAGSVALPRAAPAFKPLDMARMMRGKPQRDGMDDYRSVPSLMGSTRVIAGSSK